MDMDDYAYPAGKPWLRANMISSVDGAATRDGLSGGLGNDADRKLFQLLRAHADAIIVGAATARKEGYGAVKVAPELAALRAGRTAAPRLAVVSRRLGFDYDSELFTEQAEPVIVITTSDAEGLAEAQRHTEVIEAGEGSVDFAQAVAELHKRGLTRLLCEGGPTILAQIAAADRLDELCLTLAPYLVGGDSGRILHGPELTGKLRLTGVRQDGDHLFLRYVTN
ncbi:pyrimidine reductase family protein [Actinocorallia lasiicapitis]